MSTPEIIPQETPRQPEVTPRQEQFIVPETAQQLGVKSTPQTPQPLKGDNNQVLAEPIPSTPSNLFTVPSSTTGAHDLKELEKLAHGPEDLGRTWYDRQWLREVKRRVLKGIGVIFGN